MSNNTDFKQPYAGRLTELHLHLDGSLRPASVVELAKQQNIQLPTEDLEELTSEYLQVSEDCTDLVACLKRFELPVRILGTPEAIRRAAFDLTEDLAGENYEYAEIRFAPQYANKTGYSQEEYVQAAIDGMQDALAKYPSMKAGLILCCMRGADLREENMETIRQTAKYLGSGVCAADLAGAESLFPTEVFEDVFALAKQLDIPYTIHAGEAAGPDSIRCALKMGAYRIGHGVHAIDDPDLVKELANAGTCLEVSLTSNLQIQAYPTAESHPLGALYRAGVHTTVNSDNRTLSNVTLKSEIEKVKRAFHLTNEDIQIMQQYAREAAFDRLV